MPGHSRDNQKRLPEFYLRPTVNGQSIDPEVHAAFEQIWPWFWNYVAQELRDSDRAGDLADEVAYRVSKYIQGHPGGVRSLVGLCRVAAVNFITTTKTTEARIQYHGLSQDIELTPGASVPDWQEEVELWIWVDEILQGHDLKIRKMLELRVLEETWDEIGDSLGLTAGQARLRFRRALKRIHDEVIIRRTKRGRS